MRLCDCECEESECEPARSNADEIRDWAIRNLALGRITKELRDQLDQYADDIEVGE